MGQQSQVFTYTGGTQTYTVPSTVSGGTVTVTVMGAAGQAGANATGVTEYGGGGGPGGTVEATVPVTPGEVLTVYVGGDPWGYETGAAGGAGAEMGNNQSVYSGAGGYGGGSSAVLDNNNKALVVAGGGGGGGGAGAGSAPSYTGNPGGPGGYLGGAAGVAATSGGAGYSDGTTSGSGGGGGGGGGWAGGAGGAQISWASGQYPNQPIGGNPGTGGSSYIDPSCSLIGHSVGNNAGNGQVTITYTVPDAPLAPTNVSPAQASYLDAASAGVTFKGVYNPAPASGGLYGYVLRIKNSAAGSSYEYWNAASTSLSSTPIVNTATADSSGNFSVTIPAGILADGSSYNWSFATVENSAQLEGPFATDFTFTASAGPTVTVTGPTGQVKTATPAVSFSVVWATGTTGSKWSIWIYTQAQTQAAGFLVGSTTPVEADLNLTWPGGTNMTWVGSMSLQQGNYVAYVQVTDSHGETNQPASTSFEVAFTPPATPTLTPSSTTDPTTGAPIVSILVAGADNLLSQDDATMTSSAGTWTATNGTVAQSNAEALDGTTSLLVTAN